MATPARPSGSGRTTRASAQGTGRAAALHDAQLVIAREYGFASWPRWKQFVEARGLDTQARAGELARAACSGDMRLVSMLLDVEPELPRFDLATACVCGAAEHAAGLLARDSSLASRRGGPLDREPILYACFSRLLRSDPRRTAGIVTIVRALLDHGADANAHYTVTTPSVESRRSSPTRSLRGTMQRSPTR